MKLSPVMRAGADHSAAETIGPLPPVAGFPYLVAEKSRSLNIQSFNRNELIIHLSEAYRYFAGKGAARPPELAPAALTVAGFFIQAGLGHPGSPDLIARPAVSCPRAISGD